MTGESTPLGDEEGRRLHPVIASVLEPFDHQLHDSLGQDVAVVQASALRDVAVAARAAGFEVCVDVTAVDYGRPGDRFEVIVGLLSQQHGLRLRLRVPVPEDDPVVPSLVSVYPGANFFEREVFDMFGISFEGHPDLTRILMPDDWVGHPLRKDFAVGAVPVQFKSAHRVE